MQVFWHRGYSATSLADLVKSTGIGRASLYATYRDKHTLFVDALKLYVNRMREQMLPALEAKYPPREAIRQLFLKFTENVSERGGNRGCFLTNTALELSAHDRAVARIVADTQEQMEAFLSRQIKRGKAAGDLPASLDAGSTARGLLASLIGLVVLTRSRPDKALLGGIVDDALRRLQ